MRLENSRYKPVESGGWGVRDADLAFLGKLQNTTQWIDGPPLPSTFVSSTETGNGSQGFQPGSGDRGWGQPPHGWDAYFPPFAQRKISFWHLSTQANETKAGWAEGYFWSLCGSAKRSAMLPLFGKREDPLLLPPNIFKYWSLNFGISVNVWNVWSSISRSAF